MTTDDTVTIPRELAERAWRIADEAGLMYDTTAQELDAILNPPPEFDVETIRDIARELYLQAPFDDVPYEKLTYIFTEGHESDVRAVLTAARSAGWEMVRSDELAALHQLVDEVYGRPDERAPCSVGGGHYFYPPRLVDAIRKAKAAQK